MSTESLPATIEPSGALPVLAVSSLYQAVLSGRNARTVLAYRADYADFARFVGAPSPEAALEGLVALSHGNANAAAIAYRAHLVARGLSAATIGRRLCALRAAVRLARQLGRIAWQLDVEIPRADSYRDTRGPGIEGWRAMLAAAKEAATNPKGRRDLALVRFLHDMALRRAEAVGIDLADLDFEASTVEVLGKGKTAKVRLTMPPPVKAAAVAWLDDRGREPGPLFVRLDAGRHGADRLTGRGVHKIVGELGRRAGVSRAVRPHGLRHQGITRALDVSGGNVREARKFSRHAKLETLILYDDARTDAAGKLANLISED
jgi:integrase/recombinase XerC